MIGKTTLLSAGRAVADFARTHGTFNMQLKLARTSANPKALARLYAISGRMWSNEGLQLKVLLAENANTPLSVLAELAQDHSPPIRLGLISNTAVRGLYDAASNPTSAPAILAQHAECPVHLVRIAVGRNPATPAQVLMKLADDKEMGVKIAVARHPSATLELLLKLAGGLTELNRRDYSDEDSEPTYADLWIALENHPLVKKLEAAADKADASSAELRKLADQKLPFLCVRSALAGNANTPGDVLADLSRDSDIDVRVRVARHKNTSPSVLAALAKDQDQFVRTAALENPRTPKA